MGEIIFNDSNMLILDENIEIVRCELIVGLVPLTNNLFQIKFSNGFTSNLRLLQYCNHQIWGRNLHYGWQSDNYFLNFLLTGNPLQRYHSHAQIIPNPYYPRTQYATTSEILLPENIYSMPVTYHHLWSTINPQILDKLFEQIVYRTIRGENFYIWDKEKAHYVGCTNPIEYFTLKAWMFNDFSINLQNTIELYNSCF